MEENYTESYLPLMRRMTEVIAHDIRNPLNNILLSTAQFKLDTLPDQEDTAFYIDIIERNCDRVNEVLTDIIGVLYAPALDIKSGDMMELLHTLVAEYADKFEQRQINCTYQSGKAIIVNFDSVKMMTVLKHLLQNAIDAMPHGGEISLEVREQPGEVVLLMKDSGSGIEEAVLNHIAAPFFTTRERQKGLGLTYVSQIIKAHSGEIKIASTKGKGTDVTILLRNI